MDSCYILKGRCFNPTNKDDIGREREWVVAVYQSNFEANNDRLQLVNLVNSVGLNSPWSTVDTDTPMDSLDRLSLHDSQVHVFVTPGMGVTYEVFESAYVPAEQTITEGFCEHVISNHGICNHCGTEVA